jgi:hypothetical protein
MPREISLNDPLTGAEIKSIMVAKFEEALGRNCTLMDDLTYAGFDFTFEAKVGFLRSPTAGTLAWGAEKAGEAVTGHETLTAAYQTDSPNATRLEHDMLQPVLVSTPEGMRRRKVKFQKAGTYAIPD